MATGLENKALVDSLPQEGVHCYAARTGQIVSRRIIAAILFAALCAVGVFFIVGDNVSIPLAVFAFIGALICILVFIQTFLIAKYRVAVDYNEKRIVLRYRYSLITIPFENFDARDGEADTADQLIGTIDKSKAAVRYLVLDDVFEDACFQTSSRDLASAEDFNSLREDCFAIADAYGARNSEDAIKPIAMGGLADKLLKRNKEASAEADAIDEIVKNALGDDAPSEASSEE